MKKISLLFTVFTMLLSMTSCYDFNREQSEKDAKSVGIQILLKAESSKKAKIEEAKADFESAKLESETRLIQAQSKAKSIEIISTAIKNNPEYTKYQLIEGIKTAKTVYVPTEANIPIIEKR